MQHSVTFRYIGKNSGFFDFRISGQSLVNENSRNTDGIDMKLEPLTKLDKRNTSYTQTVASLSFYRFVVNLEQSGSWIPDAWSVKLTFSLMVIFSLKKTEKK